MRQKIKEEIRDQVQREIGLMKYFDHATVNSMIKDIVFSETFLSKIVERLNDLQLKK
jgi:hypothetical protein